MKSPAPKRSRSFAVLISALAVAVTPLDPPIAMAGREFCFGERATIVRGDGDNTIVGTSRTDVIVAGGGNDRVFAGGGDDFICGNRGNDRIHGGTGSDTIGGDRGADVPFRSNHRPDFKGGLVGDEGDDVIFGFQRIDRLQGGRGDDLLFGGFDPDSAVGVVSMNGRPRRKSWAGGLFGGGGADVLKGGNSDDELDSRDGIEGNDLLRGGHDSGFGDRCLSDPDPERACERN